MGDAHQYADVLVALRGKLKVPSQAPRQGAATTAPQQPRADTIAMCIPPLYGEYLRKTEALDAHLSYHRSLGVSWTFVYTTVPLVEWRRPANTTLLHLPWVWSVAIHQRAQNWMINDCIQRSSSHGYTWALNIDLDEYVVLPRETPTLLALANTAGVGIDVLTFGSRPGSSIEDAATRKPHCNVAATAFGLPKRNGQRSRVSSACGTTGCGSTSRERTLSGGRSSTASATRAAMGSTRTIRWSAVRATSPTSTRAARTWRIWRRTTRTGGCPGGLLCWNRCARGGDAQHGAQQAS